MATERQNTIAATMSGLSDREFSGREVAIIESGIKPEYKERLENAIYVNGRTEEGKLIINKRIADYVNGMLKPKDPITPEHIRLYKRCWADEYTDRTGKCAWGFKEVRERLGYDPKTGEEVV